MTDRPRLPRAGTDPVTHFLLADRAKAEAAVDLMGLSERQEPMAADPFEVETFAAAVERARELSAPVSKRQKLGREQSRPDAVSTADAVSGEPLTAEQWDALVSGLSPQERDDLDEALVREDKKSWDLVVEAHGADESESDVWGS